MPEADLFSWMRPFSDERVIWQGAAKVGASWPSVPGLLLRALAWWAAHVALVLLLMAPSAIAEALGPAGHAPLAWSDLLGMAVALAFLMSALVTWVLVTVLLSKVVGPSYLTLALVVVAAPIFAIAWVERVQRAGWIEALERSGGLLTAGALVLGLPVVFIVVRALRRLDTVYVITDRRVVAVLAARRVTLWETAREVVSLGVGFDEEALRTGAHLVVKAEFQFQRRRLYLRHDDPADVLALVEAA